MKHAIVAVLAGTLALAACSEQNTRPATASREPDEKQLQVLEDVHNAGVESEKDKLICRQESAVGTRITRKVCRTSEQMAQEARDAERMIEKPRPRGTVE